MSVLLKLSGIRPTNEIGKKQKAYSVLFSFIFGFASGLIAKILDSTLIPEELSLLGVIGSNLGVWIFILSLVAAYSYTQKISRNTCFCIPYFNAIFVLPVYNLNS